MVEFLGLREMADVAGVNEEGRLDGQAVDPGDCGLQRADDIRVGLLVKADVAVADLDEVQLSGPGFGVVASRLAAGYTSAHAPENSRAGPGHAVQETAAVDAVSIDVFSNVFLHL